MGHMECVKNFRCTFDEAKLISENAEKMKMTESTYMRYKILEKDKERLPPQVNELLQELKYYDLKIGTNINQIVRSCNSKKFITRLDYQMLVQYLTQIGEKYEAVLCCLKEMNQNGDYKTASDERNERS